MKLKKNSWHYKLNDMVWEDFSYYRPNDFCSYFWCTVAGICKLTVLLTLSFIGGVIAVIGWELVLGMVAIVIAFLVFMYLREKYENSEPGFVGLSWRKFRDKTCHKIEWE
jgi:hypothetical protein